jgi:hypothetical protein
MRAMPGAAGAVSFVVAFVAVQLLLARFARLALDQPNERSLHAHPVPRTGGIAVLAGSIVAFAFGAGELWLPLLLALLLAIVSFADDVKSLPVAVRLCAHVGAAGVLVWHALWPIDLWQAVLLVIGIAWLTNLYNFMDGSDGLAAGMSVIGFGTYAAVAAWGDDSADELGDSGGRGREMPVLVHVPGEVLSIAAGMFSAYALRRDGIVWSWGENSVGQLGTSGAEVASGTPRPVARLSGVVAVAAGAGDGYALRRDGTVWAWGDDSLGQLGAAGCRSTQATSPDGSRCEPVGVPVKMHGLEEVRAVVAGANTAYALRRDGTVWAWGDNSFGALGAGIGRSFVARPVPVAGLKRVVAIGAGSNAAYAVERDGSVRAWGRGLDGQLGDGRFANRAVPTRVLGLAGAAQVVGGGAMAYALDRDGRIWAWGSGFYGQLGNGLRLSVAQPTRVLKLSPSD